MARNFIPAVDIVSDDLVSTSWATFHRMVANVTDASGEVHIERRDYLNRGNAVALLPYCRERSSVLLVRQFRLPVYENEPSESMLLEVCGGIRQSGSAEEEALREAEEELGIPLSNLRKAFTAYSSPGSITEKIEYFVADYTPDQTIPETAGNIVEGERITIHEFSLDTAKQMIATGEICDLRTISLLYFLLLSVDNVVKIRSRENETPAEF